MLELLLEDVVCGIEVAESEVLLDVFDNLGLDVPTHSNCNNGVSK